MRTSPLEFCFSPTQWLSITDIEIPTRVLGVNDMRLIQLMHPEFQINKKLVGKRVLANVEICNEVADKQHGSRKHHQAGLLVLNKVLVGDLLRLIRRADCYGMNDAKGCFDCTEHIATLLVLMHFGIAYSVATTLFFLLQKAMHKIKTGYSVVESVYGNE